MSYDIAAPHAKPRFRALATITPRQGISNPRTALATGNAFVSRIVLMLIMAFYNAAVCYDYKSEFYCVAAAGTCLWAVLTLPAGRLVINLIRCGAPLFALYGAIWLSVLSAEDMSRSAYQATGIGVFIVVFSITMERVLSRDMDGIALCIAVTSVVLTSMCWSTWILYGTVRRVRFATGNEELSVLSNTVGATLVLCIPFLVYKARTSTKHRSLFWGLVAYSCSCLLIIESRAGLVLGIGGILLMQVRHMFDIRQSIAFLLMAGAGVTCCSLLIPSVGETAGSVMKKLAASSLLGGDGRTDDGQNDVDTSRMEMFEVAAHVLQTHWASGIGYEGFSLAMYEHTGEAAPSHNLIITAWAECGLLGLVTLGWFALSGLSRSIATYRRWTALGTNADYFLAVLISFCIALGHGMVRPQFENVMFYVVGAMALATIAAEAPRLIETVSKGAQPRTRGTGAVRGPKFTVVRPLR